jgi:hypothetical protein
MRLFIRLMRCPCLGMCLGLPFLAGLCVLVGCSADRPRATPFAEQDPGYVESTASADGILAEPSRPAYRQHNWEPIPARPAPSVVRHWPLWWEDEFEDAWGGHDGLFGWTWVDGVAMPGSVGRFLVNTMFYPFSPIVQWPGRVMYSDGFRRKPSEPHDARTYPPAGD